MRQRFTTWVLIASLVQLGLLAGFYTNPASRMVAVVYVAVLVANSGLLLVLAYRAFQRLRPVVAIVAALLAFPGLFLMVVGLAMWSKQF